MQENNDNQENNSQEERPHISPAGIVYGDIIYWCTIVATIVVLAGSFLTFTSTSNYIDPAYLLSSIWQGKTVDEIWQGAVGASPDGHWYLSVLGTGNGLTAAGIALGVLGVTPAIFGSAIYLYKEKQKFYGSLAVIAGAITVFAMI